MGAYTNACIVAVQVRRKSRCTASTARKPVRAEVEFLKWLDELDELEKQAVLKRLWKQRKQ